ncbi:MAG: serine/threonine protein kinase [Thermoguttaceae bacterium]|nr:serine/threonine protein kinase [Thermoguttaceae bacterium]
MSSAGQPERTGPYRHIRLVYAGQSSQLWKARDERDGRVVAVKRLLPNRVDREHVTLLNNERRVAESLKDSPSFLKVYDAGRDGGIPFLVLEWFPAPSVGQLIKLGYETYSPVLPQLIPALFEPFIPLHAAGWVHCDVKPDNFLFSPDLGVKLIDFAITEKKRSNLFARFLPKSKTIRGTATYISPEQIDHRAIDGRTDLYSLGATILELLTAAAPFSGNTLGELLNKHRTGIVPSAAMKNRNVTPQFDAFLKSLLSPDPAQRPETAAEAFSLVKRIPIFRKNPGT